MVATIGSLIVLAIAIFLFRQASNWYQARLLAELRAQIIEDVSLRGNALSAAINRRFALIDGLYAFVMGEANNEELASKFDNFSAGLNANTPGIHNISLAPDGIVQFIHPLQGNEDMIGSDLLQDQRPEVREDIQRAKETGEIILSGPIELGDGMVLIARKAVFNEGMYWGLINLVLDLEPILSRAGLDALTSDLEYALVDSNGRFLFGSQTSYLENAVVSQIELPDSYWILAAAPLSGWDSAIRKDLTIFQTGILIIISLITCLTYLIIKRQSRLVLAVEARTREIALSKLSLERKVEERTKELSALLEVTQTVNSTLELKPLLSLILSQLQRVIDYSGAAIATLEDDHLIFLDYRGPANREDILGLRVPLDQPSGYQQVYKHRKTIIYPDLQEESFGAESTIQSPKEGSSIHLRYARSWMGVPLIVKGEFIGVLRIDHVQPNRFWEQDAIMVLAFANQVAVAIENARLYEQAQDLASMRERQKLARELHDSVSQALYGISLGARTARKLLERDPDNPESLKEPMDYLLSLSDAALIEMRSLIFELRPDMLEKEGIVIVLRKQVEVLRTRHNLKVSTDFGPEPILSIEAKEDLYRVAQEAINNTIKHAQATEVRVKLVTEGDSLLLEVKDNGKGFNPNADFPGHYGLQSMRERIENRSGTLEIHSSANNGTLVRANLPL